MPHSAELISTIAAALGLALIFGFIAVRMKLPALVVYLLAGIVIGPLEKLRARGVHAVAGDASDPAVLTQAHVARTQIGDHHA